jgi:cob(I)alamin adenosyltransferase
MVNTGRGVSQGPSYLGQVFRAVGRGLRVCLVRFEGESSQGERSPLPNRFTDILEIHAVGDEDSITDGNPDDRIACARQAWQHAETAMESGDFDLVVLENIVDPIREGLLDENEVSAAISKRPEGQYVLVAGSDAPRWLIDAADLVTDATPIGS